MSQCVAYYVKLSEGKVKSIVMFQWTICRYYVRKQLLRSSRMSCLEEQSSSERMSRQRSQKMLSGFNHTLAVLGSPSIQKILAPTII